MIILVTGAAGFLGERVVKLAQDAGHEVRAFVRRRNDAGSLRGITDHNIFIGDMIDPESMIQATRGADAVIHCAAATSAGAPSLEWSRKVNVEGTRNLMNAFNLHAATNARWIQISSMSAHTGSTSVYGRTKLEADEVVRNADLPWTILRPSVIYGPGEKGQISKMLRTMRKLPVLPVVGSGRELLQPVYVDDVARAALECIANRATIGKTYMIGGADEITFNEFLKKLTRSAGIRRPFAHIPIPVAFAIARVLALISTNPPLTVDNVLGVKQLQRVEIESAMKEFGFEPKSFDEGLNLTFPT